MLHFSPLPQQHVMCFLTPLLPDGAGYPRPQTIHHSCWLFQGTSQGPCGSGWPWPCGHLPGVALSHGSIPNIIRR